MCCAQITIFLICLQECGVESSEDDEEDVVDLEDIGGATTTASKQRKGTKDVAQGCEGGGQGDEGGETGSGNTSGALREMVTPVLRQSLTKQGQLNYSPRGGGLGGR